MRKFVELVPLALAVGLTLDVLKAAIPHLPLIWFCVGIYYAFDLAKNPRVLVWAIRLKARLSERNAMYTYLSVFALGGILFSFYWWALNSLFAPRILAYQQEQAKKTRENTPDKPANPAETKTAVGLYLDCDYPQNFPVTIPAGEVIHVLRIHPTTLKNNTGLLDVAAPPNKKRVWPSPQEAPPMSPGSGIAPTINFTGIKCTVKRLGDSTVYNIVIPITFNQISSIPYNVVIDPLGSSKDAFGEFTFYMLYACYVDPKPGEWISWPPPLVAEFPKVATLQVLGESTRREVPITMPFRDSFPKRIILLLPASRRWSDLPSLYGGS
jgi:hypothetical protein